MKKILVFCTVAFFLAFSINENYSGINQEYSESLQDVSSIAMAGGETMRPGELGYCPLFSSGDCDTCNSGKSCDNDNDCK